MLSTLERRSQYLVVTLATALALGCGGGDGGEEMAEDGGMEEAAMAFPVDTATAATITGAVNFEGTPPEPRPINMSEEPTCADKYQNGPQTQQVVVNENGTLKNVFVYVKSGPHQGMEFPAPQEPVTLDQDGCRYEPHVFGIRTGQELVIKNSDGILHNINAKPQQNRGFNISQPVTMETTRTFNTPEVMVPLECDVHGWMNAYVGVLDHPYYSVTGEQGGFTLDRLPPGTYTIEAWHEEYGTQTQEVTVSESGSAEVTFTFSSPSA